MARSVGHREIRAGELRAVDEQLHRLELRDRVPACAPASGRASRATAPGTTARPRCRALPGWSRGSADAGTAQKRVGQLRAAVEQVLAVVQQQQQPLVLEMLGERLDRSACPALPSAPAPSPPPAAQDPGRPAARVRPAIRRRGSARGSRRRAAGQAGLAAAARAGQRQQARPASSRRNSVSSLSRPTKLVTCCGRLLAWPPANEVPETPAAIAGARLDTRARVSRGPSGGPCPSRAAIPLLEACPARRRRRPETAIPVRRARRS